VEAPVGVVDGIEEGVEEGVTEGIPVGEAEGVPEGAPVGDNDGLTVGTKVMQTRHVTGHSRSQFPPEFPQSTDAVSHLDLPGWARSGMFSHEFAISASLQVWREGEDVGAGEEGDRGVGPVVSPIRDGPGVGADNGNCVGMSVSQIPQNMGHCTLFVAFSSPHQSSHLTDESLFLSE
jgi:hypothetical protein